jgi:TonB family protein
MTIRFACRLAFAAVTMTWALPGIAHDVANPETRKKVSEAVELYYQANPKLRPTENWFTSKPVSTCTTPHYPRAAIADNLEGTAVLQFQLNADGKPVNAYFVKASGWAVLDQAALEALSTCVMKPEVPNEWLRQPYHFRLS